MNELKTNVKSIGELLKWGYSQEGCLYQINFKFYLQDSHFFSSCVDKIHICFQVVLARLPFVFKLS